MTSTEDNAINLTGIAPQATETPLYGPATAVNPYVPSAPLAAAVPTADTLVWAVVALAALILILILAMTLKPR